MSTFYLLWRNLTRKKIRTALTLGSIFVAFVLFCTLLAVKTAFSAGVEIAGLDRLITMHKVSLVQPIPISYQNKMMAVDGVEEVASAMWFGGVYQDPKNFFGQFAVEPERYLEVYPEIQLSEEERQAWIATRTGAIVGKPTADRFGWQVGDKIPLQGTIFQAPDGGAWEFDIVGIFTAEPGFDDTGMLFQREYLTETIPGLEGVAGWYIVKVADPDRSALIAEEIDALFANSPAETKTSTEKAFAQGFANQAGNIGAIITGILTVVFFTLLLVAGNTMAQSVRERTSEIGVLKTLGFTHGQTLGLVLGESYLLTFLGGGTGLALAAWVLHAFDIGGGILPTLYLPTWGLLLGLGLLVFMGFAAGAIPAWQAHRLTIVDALRRKG